VLAIEVESTISRIQLERPGKVVRHPAEPKLQQEFTSMPKSVPTLSDSVTKVSDSVTSGDNLSATSAEDDTRTLALFRDWLAAHRASDFDRCREFERELIATPADSGPTVSIKSYLVSYSRLPCAPDDITLRSPELFDEDPDPDDPDDYEWMRGAILVSLLRDAARLVPEIAELAAPIIDEDAALIEAEIEIQAEDPGPERLTMLLDRIARTEAKTPRGEEIKRRHAA
jgi:hypothetical protein